MRRFLAAALGVVLMFWMRRVGSTVDGGRTVPLVRIYCSQECADLDARPGGDGA